MRQTETTTNGASKGVPNPVLAGCVEPGAQSPWEGFIEKFDGAIRRGISYALRCCGVTPRPERREDLRQEVYCRLLENDHRVLRACRGRRDAQVGAYLRRVAWTVTVDCLRLDAADKRGADVTVLLGDAAAGLPEIRSKAMSAEHRFMVRAARRRFFERCREALGPATRHSDTAMLYLAAFEGWPTREIAPRYGLTVNAANSRLSRLTKRLSDAGMELPGRMRRAGAAVN